MVSHTASAEIDNRPVDKVLDHLRPRFLYRRIDGKVNTKKNTMFQNMAWTAIKTQMLFICAGQVDAAT